MMNIGYVHDSKKKNSMWSVFTFYHVAFLKRKIFRQATSITEPT